MTTFAVEYEQRCREWSDIVDHLPRIYEEAVRFSEPQIIELGVRAGNSTATFLAAIEKVGGHLWSVDPMVPWVPDWWFPSPLWTFLQADDLDVADKLPDGVDLLFVDTTHAYVQTVMELELYAPKVRAGGTILMHDTELEYPELAPGDAAFPVMRAIVDAGFECEYVTGCNGLGIVRR